MPSHTIARIDAATGASGDKLVCALIGACEALGVLTRDRFARTFESLVGGIEIVFDEDCDQGICGLRMKVVDTAHEHAAPADGHGEHHHAGRQGPGHGHRTWADIAQMITGWHDAGHLSPGAAERAQRTFEAVARAEGAVHGQPAERVHFHEVGAIDSIVDTVGACYLIDLLGIERIYAAPVVTGFGTVACAHGILPVPAPATARILEGIPTTTGPHEGEMTTPTGAALLRCNVTDWTPMSTMTPRAMGIGLGSRTIEGTANALRVVVGASASQIGVPGTGGGSGLGDASPEPAIENCVLLQSNIDHVSAEVLASCCEDLMNAGALDVWQQPIVMKKGRLASLLNVLVRPADTTSFEHLMAKLVGTLGIRRTLVERTVLPRSHVQLQTQFGTVRYKAAEAAPGDQRLSWVRPEADDVARIARQTGRGYAEIHDALMQAWRQQH